MRKQTGPTTIKTVKKPKDIDELFEWINSLIIRDIQIAIQNIDLYKIKTLYEAIVIADALTMKVAGFKASDISAKWMHPRRREFTMMCWEYAIMADQAYNPDRGY